MCNKQTYKQTYLGPYLTWLEQQVGGPKNHGRLFGLLFATPFTYILPMDGNRYEDGIDLRYRYTREADIPDPECAVVCDTSDCSVLEMMVALAKRLEDAIMADDDLGNRTGVWFWEMIYSLGLSDFTDDRWGENGGAARVRDILAAFVSRTYQPDGRGGLFRSVHGGDMRRMEIWDQAMLHLNEVLASEA